MQVSVESTGALERRMTVTVPEERIAEAVEERLKSMAGRVKIDGFRPGKVPFSVIRQKYAGQVRGEVIGEVMQSTYYEAVNQENLSPAGYPSIEPKVMESGKDLEYEATFEVYPEITLAPMDKVTIEKPVSELSDADVDKTLETIRKQHKTWEEADKAAESGDQVVIDFLGKVDGEAFAGGEASDFALELGAGRMIPGFEDPLIGAKAGEERTINVTFPENYQAEHLAGKAAEFTATVKRVEEAKLPELNDDLAKQLGVEGGIDKLREEVRTNMQREIDQALKGKAKSAVMDALLEANEIEPPKALVQQEAEGLANQMKQSLSQQGIDTKDMTFDPQHHLSDAERRVRLGLILSEVVKSNEMKAEEADVKSFIEDMASSYEKPEEVVSWYYADKNRLAEIQSLVLEEKIVNWVLDQAKVKEKQMSFDELMGTANQ